MRTILTFQSIVLCLASLAYSNRVDGGPLADAKPNIILFLVDDMGWQDTSVPFHTERTAFNERYRTPAMEHLAARGVRFTNAYASAPVCTPTRTSIMTGMSPGRSRITYWTLHEDTDTSKNHPTLAPPEWSVNGLNDEHVTLPKLLSEAGYRTIHVGKAHFGAHGTSGADPTNLGFEINIAGHASGAPASYYGKHNFSAAGKSGDPSQGPTVWDVPGLEAYHGQDVYLTDALAIEACSAIKQAVADGKPFYLNMAPYAVHTPIMANGAYLDQYEDLHPKEAAYATMIASMDAALGLIMLQLDTLGVTDNTIIIFSSDNGGLSAHARGGEPHTHNAPLKSGKGSAYEGGVRAPTIISWPGVTRGGSTNDALIISHDFFPTILAMAGVEIPTEYASQVDGRDLTPLLRDNTTWSDERTLAWHQPHQWGASGPGIEPFTSLRKGDWKLLYFHGEERFELYDLAMDIGEIDDRARTEPDRLRRLAGELDRWIAETGAQLSLDKATGKPVAMPGEVVEAFLASDD